MQITHEMIMRLIRRIETENQCHVVGAENTDEAWWLDCMVPAPVRHFEIKETLFSFSLESVDFDTKILRFMISEEELADLLENLPVEDAPAALKPLN